MPSRDLQFLRVRVKATKAHITIAAGAFDERLHVVLKQDPLDRNGHPRPAKYPVPSDEASPDDAEGEAAATATTTHEANKEAKP